MITDAQRFAAWSEEVLIKGLRGAFTRAARSLGDDYQTLRASVRRHPQYPQVYALAKHGVEADPWEWAPHAERITPDEHYVIHCMNGETINVKRHWHNVGGFTANWWKVHWPGTTLLHEVSTLKDACALAQQYADNNYTVPLEGVFDSCPNV